MRTDISFFGASTRNRVLVIIGVIALSLWMIYPVQNSLKLGLDLNGGVQLVLRVKTDDALLLQTQAAAERLRTALTEATVAFSSVEVVNATAFRVQGIGDDAALEPRGGRVRVDVSNGPRRTARHVPACRPASRARFATRPSSRPFAPSTAGSTNWASPNR